MEYSTFPFLETKTTGLDGQFSGYASTYGKDLTNDRILPGAYAKSIVSSRGQVPIFWGHPGISGTADWIGLSSRLVEDQKGLFLDGNLALKTTAGNNAFEFLRFAAQQDYKAGLSIGFVTNTWDMDGSERVLKEIDVKEVSIVPFPAQPRARIEEVKTVRDLEDALRDAGYSTLEAKTLIATVRRLDTQRPEAQRDVSGLVRNIRNEKLRLTAAQFFNDLTQLTKGVRNGR